MKNKFVTKTADTLYLIDLVLADLQRIVLVNIYAPNDVNQQVSFFKELQEQLQEFSEETIIIGGDFNCTLSKSIKKEVILIQKNKG